MTPQEALILVKECGLNIDGTKHTECEKVVLNAIEKQIPKKPIDVSLTQYNFLWVCPNCESQHANEWCGTERKLPFCSICGQALDWSDT